MFKITKCFCETERMFSNSFFTYLDFFKLTLLNVLIQ